MVSKLFWEDPYRTELDTLVASVNGPDVTLEDTIFFAFSGGQESDTGTIAGHPVLVAAKDGKQIVYTLPGEHGLRAGAPVKVRIDWPGRYRLMRLHFAAELVLELTYRRLGTVEKIGAHIAQDKARIDFNWPENIGPLLPQLKDQAQAVIDADLVIATGFEDPVEERRYWEVAGFARVPCGGTHVRSTGEVGALTLKRHNVGRGKERIEISID